MDKDKKIENLEKVIKQMLTPLKDVPLNVVINSISGHKVIPIDKTDKRLISNLEKAVFLCGVELKKKPIKLERRANEVGNDIEPYAKKNLSKSGFIVEEPTSVNGKTKRSGYPDLLIRDANSNNFFYVECKTYDIDRDINSSFRSFYLSPSKEFKVSKDAGHLVLSFGMKKTSIGYVPKEYKIIDACDLLCDVKYEFNSNNKRMYSNELIISAGEIEALGTVFGEQK